MEQGVSHVYACCLGEWKLFCVFVDYPVKECHSSQKAGRYK